MVFEIDWERIYLREDPFAMSPPSRPEAAVWADMSALRAEFERALQEAQGSTQTQVILCRGPVGGGKTHASVYFSLKERWPKQVPCVRDVHVLRVPTPKEVGKPDRDFYIDVMETLGMAKIRWMVQREVAALGYEQARDALARAVISADFVNAILNLVESNDESPINSYFFRKCTSAELRKLGLNRNIEKTQDYFRILAGILSCFIGLSDSRKLDDHDRFCLWLDEMEDFVYFSPGQYRPFTQGLRELVDRLPSFYTMFLNFTLTSPEEYEEIELILGNYLIDRVTQEIIFDEMDGKEKLTYVAELLAHYRLQSKHSSLNTNEGIYFPFREDALTLLLFDLPRRTPRNVNKRCRNALLKAFMSGRFSRDAVKIIDVEFVQQMTKEEIDRDVG